MNVRTLLQTELWSEETSRRILRRTWKIARPVAVVSGILALLLAFVFVVEWRWLTTGERKAGQAALAKIEELEQLETNASDGFDAINSQAKALTTVAGQKAWTLRDRRAADLLELYRWIIETDHGGRVREIEMRAIMAERRLKAPSNADLSKKFRDSQLQTYSSMRSLLRNELD